jgi:hypothetical protein
MGLFIYHAFSPYARPGAEANLDLFSDSDPVLQNPD